MTCLTCGRHRTWHGSEEGAAPGSYLSEMGCHDGVRMDDDEYHEGWAPDTIYPPCRFNPAYCAMCKGSGNAPAEMAQRLNQDDCADCSGTGWANGNVQWPSSEDGTLIAEERTTSAAQETKP